MVHAGEQSVAEIHDEVQRPDGSSDRLVRDESICFEKLIRRVATQRSQIFRNPSREGDEPKSSFFEMVEAVVTPQSE